MRFTSINIAIVPLTTIVLLLAFLINPARATVLYSVDTLSDQLVTLDTSTGAVSAVGALGKDVTTVKLGTFGNRLFMLEQVILHELDHTTGGIISSVLVDAPTTNTSRLVEGIVGYRGQLLLSFKNIPHTAGGGATSNAIGAVDPATGVLSDVSQFDPNEDIDFLTTNSAQSLVAGGDIFVGPNTVFKNYSLSPGAVATAVGSINVASFSQILFDMSDELFGLSNGDTLYRFGSDQTLGTFTTQSVQSGFRLLGLANQVPEPSTIAMLCLGIVGVGYWRRERRAVS